MNNLVRLGDHAYITKLAGFEHSKYIQYNATHTLNDVPLIIGKNIRDGKVVYKFDWYLPQEISDVLPRSVLKKKCIVLPYVGNLGDLAIFKNEFPCHLGSNVAKIELISNELILEYLYYYLKSTYGQSQLLKDKQGSVQPNITIDSIRETKVVKFEIPVQQKIASVLSALDSKIELNNRINAELEAMAKTLYDYWFVQFDFPDKNGKPYKTSGGKMVWNEVLKREIPEGWEVKFLRTEIEIERGISYTSKEINGDGIPMINLNSFNLDGTYKSEGVKTYSGKFLEKNIVKSGDLLIAATDVTRNADIIGKAILVPDYYKENLVFSMDIAKIISKYIPSSFLMMLFNSNHYHNYIKWYASGTIVLHLNLDGINRYNTELPPTSLLKKFDEFYLPIANRVYMTAKENEKLAELRDWLLPMLMNGQVKVGEGKEVLKAAE